jgi:hypothetical protein
MKDKLETLLLAKWNPPEDEKASKKDVVEEAKTFASTVIARQEEVKWDIESRLERLNLLERLCSKKMNEVINMKSRGKNAAAFLQTMRTDYDQYVSQALIIQDAADEDIASDEWKSIFQRIVEDKSGIKSMSLMQSKNINFLHVSPMSFGLILKTNWSLSLVICQWQIRRRS